MDDDLMLAVDWSELHGDLLFLITDKLKSTTFSLSEYIRFGAVCFEWRSFCIQNYKEQIKLPSNLPLLLIPNPSHEDYNEQVMLQDDFDDDNHGDKEEEELGILHDDFDDDDNHEDEEEEQLEILQDDFDDDDDNHEDGDDNHEDEEEEQLEILQDDFDDNDNHEDGDDNHEEEEQLEILQDGLYYVEAREPRQYYYKPKDIWKGQDTETRYKSTRSFYSLSFGGKVYQDFQLPVPYYKNCRGSSHGWLITVDEEEQPDGTYIYPVRLLNPFRSVNNEIQLPPLTPIRELDEEPTSSYFLIKAYLSANPSSLSNPSKDLLVLGMYGSNRFVFCRPGDIAWTYLPLERKFRPIQDLICYKSRFLAIIQNGSVLELDFAHHLHPKPPSVKFVALSPANGSIFDKKYLVESGGDLLQVQRYHISGDDTTTTGFRAFKLNDDASNDDDEWVEMDHLDGRMLFLGDNSSICLSSADFPGSMPNCIYFTDDNYEACEFEPWVGPHDIGIFNFEDKSIVFNHRHIMPQPIWIQPML